MIHVCPSRSVNLLPVVTGVELYFYFSYEPKKKIERLTVLKSVHIHKKHRVQYEMRTHYRCIEVRTLDDPTLCA